MTTKNPTKWLPQPVGFGYVNTVTSKVLVTGAGVVITDSNNHPLVTTTTEVTGKHPTVWTNTGA